MCAGRGEDEDVLEQGRVELCGRACGEERVRVEEARPVHCTHHCLFAAREVRRNNFGRCSSRQTFDRHVRAQSMSDLAVAYVFLSLLTLVIALLVAAILVTP